MTNTLFDDDANKKAFITLCIKNLEQRELIYTIQNDRFKMKAYQEALQKLSLLKESDCEIDEKIIKNCKFGKSLQEKILFMFNNNKDLPDNESITERDISISNFMKIQNIGLKKAIILYDENKITSIEMLKENEHLLNSKQCTGLKYHDHIQKRIPRKEIDSHYNIFTLIKDKVKFNFVFNVVGSYRRNVSTSGDIDILMYVEDDVQRTDKKSYLNEVVKTMQNEGYVPDDGVFALGEKKFMGMCKLKSSDTYRRLDILITTKKEYPFSILYFTGSKSFNILMREQANKVGLVLNEKGFTQYNKKTKDKEDFYETVKNKIIKNEKDIFDILKIKYTEPENRYSNKFELIH